MIPWAIATATSAGGSLVVVGTCVVVGVGAAVAAGADAAAGCDADASDSTGDAGSTGTGASCTADAAGVDVNFRAAKAARINRADWLDFASEPAGFVIGARADCFTFAAASLATTLLVMRLSKCLRRIRSAIIPGLASART